MTEKLLDVSHSDENIQLNDSYKNTQSQKEMLNEKYKDLIILREENDNLVEKLSNLLTEIVNKKQGFRNIYLDIESANKKKKDLETENYYTNEDLIFYTKERDEIFKLNNKLMNRIINTIEENKKLELELEKIKNSISCEDKIINVNIMNNN